MKIIRKNRIMDTRFWGPSAWKLLHLIAYSQSGTPQFWKSIQYVLPCKYCRSSISGYYETNPIPKSSKDDCIWMYHIHNSVNQKLRGEGQPVAPDPPFSVVHEYYKEFYNQGCNKTIFYAWPFLFSLAYNHPYNCKSDPMISPPYNVKSMSDEEKNKYNLMTPQERLQKLKTFWTLLPDVFPYQEWTHSWKKHAGSLNKALQSRKTMLQWLWKIRKGMEHDLHILSHETFFGICKTVSSYSASASPRTMTTKCRKTCRKRQTRKNKVSV